LDDSVLFFSIMPGLWLSCKCHPKLWKSRKHLLRTSVLVCGAFRCEGGRSFPVLTARLHGCPVTCHRPQKTSCATDA
uniref:Uncharacterized protein n=1 Tax=Xiphophorus couchianus TaxID=32473 RepID=A0A3B5KX15_9TELE